MKQNQWTQKLSNENKIRWRQSQFNFNWIIKLKITWTKNNQAIDNEHCNEGFTMEENTQIEEINIQNKTEYLGNWKRK